jgi:beta-galactosidase
VAPLSTEKLDLPRFDAKAGVESFLNVDFSLKSDTLWAEKGWRVARNQIRLSPRVEQEPHVVGAAIEVSDAGGGADIEVVSGGAKAVFSRETGTLSELVMDGKTILKDAARGIVSGPRLTCERAFTDNDIWLSGGSRLDKPGSFVMSGLSQLAYHARPIEVDAQKGVVRTCVEVTGSKSAGFTHECAWTFAADGAVSVENVVTPHGTMPMALPRLGLSFRLDKSLENVKWYGRGPRENYIDRCTGSFFGEWESTVDGMFEPYVRPQDNGCRSDVRWVSLTDGEGRGVRFAASEPMFVQAMHYSVEDLVFSRHLNGQRRSAHPLVRRDDVRLNLDIRQLGLGGASCGPKPMDKYIFPVKPERWTLFMTPER